MAQGFSLDLFLRAALVFVGAGIVYSLNKPEKKKGGRSGETLNDDTLQKWMKMESTTMITRFRERVANHVFESQRNDSHIVQQPHFGMFTHEARDEVKNFNRIGVDSARDLLIAYSELEWVLVFITQKRMAVRNFVSPTQELGAASDYTLPWNIFRAFDLQRFLLTVEPDQPLRAKAPSDGWIKKMDNWATEIRTFATAMFEESLDPSKAALKQFNGLEDELSNPLVKNLARLSGDALLLPINSSLETVPFLADRGVARTYEKAWTALRTVILSYSKTEEEAERKLRMASAKESEFLKGPAFGSAKDSETAEAAFSGMFKAAKSLYNRDSDGYKKAVKGMDGNPLSEKLVSTFQILASGASC